MLPRFETERIAQEWIGDRVAWNLRALVLDFCIEAEKHDWSPLITCLLRTVQEDLALHGNAIHCVGRAADIRTMDIQPDAVVEVCEAINKRWEYNHGDKRNLLCAVSKEHGTGPHIHLQVNPMTKIIGLDQ